jgi:membrane protein implicated in regulation of membrane protease activity
MRNRREVWGDEPEERDAAAIVERFETDPEIQGKLQEHPNWIPAEVVWQFIKRNGKRVAVTIAGFALVLAGLAGLLLPIIPGWLLIIPGLALLATEYVWARRLLKLAQQKATQAKEALLGKKGKAPSPEEPAT